MVPWFIVPPPFLPPLFISYIAKSWPKEYKDALKHFINANIELLKAVNSLVESRIKEWERVLSEIEEVKKERAKVE